jgi:hypothetical protein
MKVVYGKNNIRYGRGKRLMMFWSMFVCDSLAAETTRRENCNCDRFRPEMDDALRRFFVLLQKVIRKDDPLSWLF